MLHKLSGKIPIVLFHRVSPDPDPCWPPLTPLQFEETIRLLSKHYTFYSLDQILSSRKDIKKNACCIVFDDGFLDFKLHALPILVKYKVPTTLFVPTDNIDRNAPIWTSTVDNILLNTNDSQEDKEIAVGKEKITLKLRSEKNIFKTAARIKNILMSYEIGPRDLIIKNIKDLLSNGIIKDHPMLSWKDIAEIKSKYPELIDIQNHTHTHPFLPSLKQNEIEAELKISNDILTGKKFNPTDKLAYPIGGYNQKAIDASLKLFNSAFAVENRLVELKKLTDDPEYRFKIPRFNIHTTNPKETFLFLNEFHSRVLFLFK